MKNVNSFFISMLIHANLNERSVDYKIFPVEEKKMRFILAFIRKRTVKWLSCGKTPIKKQLIH